MIKVFVENHFRVNTCLVFDSQSRQCAMIDVACQSENERHEIINFIKDNALIPTRLLITQPHIDHICGTSFVAKEYSLKLECHKDAAKMLKISEQSQANLLGFSVGDLANVELSFINDNEKIVLGEQTSLVTMDTSGHCAGSFSFYNEQEGFVITGDALFASSIGRTDLPTGDLDLLISNIKSQLLTLPPATIVYPGHGEKTTIGFEKENNPFLQITI
jgi:glyoxylase-like metal-dependent hydrolase (beta-lactamase superfamily II)